MLFPDMGFYEMPELGEVPLKSFTDTEKQFPLWIWNVLGRLQWYAERTRQPETRNSTIQRANKVIELCEREKEDCILITHGFFMRTLFKVLKKRGYSLSGSSQLEVKNLQIVWAEKKIGM